MFYSVHMKAGPDAVTLIPGAARRRTSSSLSGSRQATMLQCFDRLPSGKDGCERLTRFDHTHAGIVVRAES